MNDWAQFESAAPDFASAGRRLLVGDDGVAIAFFASASVSGRPHVSPVCPIFCGDGLYLSASAASPKVRDLRANPVYVLHAFLAANDEEFQVAGAAVEVLSPERRGAVQGAIPFPAFEKEDPIFHLAIERCLWVYWEKAGTPETHAVRKRWSSAGA